MAAPHYFKIHIPSNPNRIIHLTARTNVDTSKESHIIKQQLQNTNRSLLTQSSFVKILHFFLSMFIQTYQAELESLSLKLEEENEKLMKAKVCLMEIALREPLFPGKDYVEQLVFKSEEEQREFISKFADVGNVLVDLEENAKSGILVAYDSEIIGIVGVAYPLQREAAIVVEMFDHITFWSRNVFHTSQ